MRVRLWIARLAALLALLGAVAAVYAAVASVESTDELTVEEAQQAAARLNAVNGSVAGQLGTLTPGASPRAAQEAVRAAADEARSLADTDHGQGALVDRLDAVLRAELAYLDALGSTLNNPRSPLKGTIRERGATLREQLQSLPGGDAERVRGGAALVAYSDARIA